MPNYIENLFILYTVVKQNGFKWIFFLNISTYWKGKKIKRLSLTIIMGTLQWVKIYRNLQIFSIKEVK